MVLTPDFDSRPVISFQHVWKTYPTGTEALRDINLVVPEGDFLFLVGPSGAGKSTLVRLLIREEKPSKGTLFVAGLGDHAAVSSHQRAGRHGGDGDSQP